MTKCAMKNCKNNSSIQLKKSGVTYHRFPQNYDIREKWRRIVAKDRDDEFYKPKECSIICSKHFLESDLYNTQKGYQRLKKTAIPQIQSQSSSCTTQSGTKTKQNQPDTCQDGNIIDHPEPSKEDFAHRELEAASDGSESGLSSIFDSPRISHFKNKLMQCYQRINMKNRQIIALKRQNRRLMKRNICLKEVVQDLKKEVQEKSSSKD